PGVRGPHPSFPRIPARPPSVLPRNLDRPCKTRRLPVVPVWSSWLAKPRKPPMYALALRNLTTRPMRTLLGLVGLSIPIFGVLGLFSLSMGLRHLVADTLGQIQGLMVVRVNAPTPVFSDLPAETAEVLKRIPGVRVVAPEVWKVAPPIDGAGMFASLSLGLM